MAVVVVVGVDAGVVLAAASGVAEAALEVDVGAAAASEVAAALGAAAGEVAGEDMGAAAMVAAEPQSTQPYLPAWAHLHPSMAWTGVVRRPLALFCLIRGYPELLRRWQMLAPYPMLSPYLHSHAHLNVEETHKRWAPLLIMQYIDQRQRA